MPGKTMRQIGMALPPVRIPPIASPRKALIPITPCRRCPMMGTREESYKRLILVLRDMKRCTIVTSDPAYIHAEFRSALFGFVDDVDFVFDDKAHLIQFRSASRTGYYDFGVNRKRMNEISARYLNMNPEQKSE